jgi:hypothetical protein
VEFIEAEDLDETELNAKWRTVVLRNEFYDREVKLYEE